MPATENKEAPSTSADAIAQLNGARLGALLQPVLQRRFVGAHGGDDAALTEASVLVPLIIRASGVSVLFTQRTAHLKDHPGQISFPGGRVEAEDASPTHTALREAQEEVGLAPAAIEVIGFLPEHRTGTGFLVMPVVGLVRPPFELSAHAEEVAQIFEVPLAFLMDAANHQPHSWTKNGVLHHSMALRYDEHCIWGATAAIVLTLYQALRQAMGGDA